MSDLIYKYWGKAKKKETGGMPNYHLLVYHCLDVAAVGQVLISRNTSLQKKLAKMTGLSERTSTDLSLFFLALHDLGKFSESFQLLYSELRKKFHRDAGARQYTHRHDTLGFIVWNEIWRSCDPVFDNQPGSKSFRSIKKYFKLWHQTVSGHHGEPPFLSDGSRPFYPDNYFAPVDIEAVRKFIKAASGLFLKNIKLADCLFELKEALEKFKKASWWIAGFTTICDWIGSDTTYFTYMNLEKPLGLGEYWKNIALKKAAEAVEKSGILPSSPRPYQGIQDIFKHVEKPTPLQAYCENCSILDGPQLFIIEDATGSGKTEAALTLVHRFISKNTADGFYIGLPTMATANAMFDRMAKAYGRLYSPDQHPSLILAHGARHLSEQFRTSICDHNSSDSDYSQNDLSASSQCSAWLADSGKKATLADVGIGTIDQALLGILPARHQSLRLIGLLRKVLVVDEVHAYDSYMQSLLVALLRFQATIGGSVILLSATLPQKMREDLANAYLNALGSEKKYLTSKDCYPLVTKIAARETEEKSLDTRRECARNLSVKLLHEEKDVFDLIRDAEDKGNCVCWVRNTVADARNAYARLKNLYNINEENIQLFHSRFTLYDRLNIENQVLDNFNKESEKDKRHGKILIATQVVEQSLDLDFDVMVSDLAPIDLLIQRAGRLHRHQRPGRDAPIFHVYGPDPVDTPKENWFSAYFPQGTFVYPHTGRLWLTSRLLKKQGAIDIPDKARLLIEGVYGDLAEEIPEALENASLTADGDDFAEKHSGTWNALSLSAGYCRESGLWDKEVRVPTRIGEESIEVFMAKFQGNKLVSWANGKYPWDLSSIRINRKRLCNVSENIPEIQQEVLDELKETEKRLRDDSVVLPLVKNEGNEWHGIGMDEKGREVAVVYCDKMGLLLGEECEGRH
ncbi:MAG: CRISPR-associated helicase Cas3' [Dissulfuribacterales bacterium]